MSAEPRSMGGSGKLRQVWNILRLHWLISCVVVGMAGCQSMPPLTYASSVPTSEPAGLTLNWLGTSTVAVSDGTSTVMIDGFVSRTGKTRTVLAGLGLPVIGPDEGAFDSALMRYPMDQVDALFVSHAHHDHVLDAARVANASNARVYGSASAGRIVQADRSDIAFSELKPGQAVCVGAFEVTALASPHKSSFIAPDGEVRRGVRLPASLRTYRAGPSFAFTLDHPKGRVLIIPSAVVPPYELPAYPAAHVVLLGIGLLGHEDPDVIDNYWKAAVSVLTKRVHPIHWDDFTRSLSSPLKPFFFDRPRQVIPRFERLKPAGAELSYLPALTPVRLPVYSAVSSVKRVCPAKS